MGKYLKAFSRAGHIGSLVGALVHFTVSTAVWVMIGALGIYIAEDFGLSATEKGLMISLPILVGALLRIPAGMAADWIGPKRTGAVGLALTLLPLLAGWLGGGTLREMLFVGVMLGVAGAAFAVVLPLVSRCYPAEYQGLVMGIVGSGNCGTVIAALAAPRLAELLGWRAVFGLAILPVLLALALYGALAAEQPRRSAHQRPADYLKVLREVDTWRFSLFYLVTFGGFVGLASFLPIFFYDQYGVGKVAAGNLAALCIFGGSLLRPVGGLLADRRGGVRVLMALFGIVAVAMFLIGRLPPLPWVIAGLFFGVSALGMGNGVVFQLVPQRFQREIGVVTGVVGAAGGLGGFLLPSLLGLLKDLTGSYGGGLLIFGCAALCCMGALAFLQHGWTREGRAVVFGGEEVDTL